MVSGNSRLSMARYSNLEDVLEETSRCVTCAGRDLRHLSAVRYPNSEDVCEDMSIYAVGARRDLRCLSTARMADQDDWQTTLASYIAQSLSTASYDSLAMT